MNKKEGGFMVSLINKVKQLSSPMFFIFVISKVLVGIGLGALLASFIGVYAWWILGIGVGLSLWCAISALKK